MCIGDDEKEDYDDDEKNLVIKLILRCMSVDLN